MYAHDLARRLAQQVPFFQVLAADEGRVQVKLTFAEDPRATVSLVERADNVVVTGDIPEGGSVVLAPQKGMSGALASLSEMKVEDAAVDAAWVIRGDDAPLVLAMLPELKLLAPHAPRITLEGTRLTVRARDVEEAQIAHVAEAALALWHRAVFFRIGA